jgi:hypothetical protein
MITLIGFSNEAFNYLLANFAPVYDEYSPFVDEDGFIFKKLGKIGRPHSILPED